MDNQYQVIAPFRNSENGQVVEAGDNVPEYILADEVAIERLSLAGCIAIVDSEKQETESEKTNKKQGRPAK